MSDAPVLEATDLARSYAVGGLLGGRGVVQAVEGVSFQLQPGRTLAVVGESGSGKSTLARMVTLVEPPSAGRLRIDAVDVTAADRATRRRLVGTVQMVFQNPYGSLNPRMKVGAALEEPLAVNAVGTAAERRAAADAMLSKVGLRPEHYDRYPHMFSGGQRQRIAIARALMLRPRILVADEPVSALDISIQAQILNLLMDLKEEFHLALMFISHDLSVVRHIADDVMVMYFGRAAEHGPAETVLERPRHPYTRALLASAPAVDPAHRRQRIPLTGELPSPLRPPGGCAFHTRCPYATGVCRQTRPALRPVDGRLVACHHAETASQV